jgi:4a-hydroxytetrahydrobiopterin dehydratase
MAVKLERQRVAEQLQKLSDWTLQGDQIERISVFENFADAMIFVNKVAEIAEEEEHHPDIRIVYNRVTLALSTHDAGGLTQKDFQMAHRIDSLGDERVGKSKTGA